MGERESQIDLPKKQLPSKNPVLLGLRMLFFIEHLLVTGFIFEGQNHVIFSLGIKVIAYFLGFWYTGDKVQSPFFRIYSSFKNAIENLLF